jgi:hypothetical protein
MINRRLYPHGWRVRIMAHVSYADTCFKAPVVLVARYIANAVWSCLTNDLSEIVSMSFKSIREQQLGKASRAQ